MSKKQPFGSLLIIDADKCEGNLIDKEHIQTFINTLVNDLGMKKKGDTIFEYFENNEYNRERDIVGWSVVQIISLSSITLHINEISKTVYLDLFSCSSIDELKVFMLFNDFFEPTMYKKQLLTRDAKIKNFFV